MCAELAAPLVGPETGWSSLGVVVGATYPQEAERIRELLPNSLFLVPGYGAQGESEGAQLGHREGVQFTRRDPSLPFL